MLSHFNSTASIVTGNWQRVDDFGLQPPASATIFEYYRKGRRAGPMDSWLIATEYRRNTAYLFVGEGMDELLAIGPPDFPLLAASTPVSAGEVAQHARRWLGL